MALENAKKFVEMIENDKALKERIAKMQPEESLAAAKELGLFFTLEELKEAGKAAASRNLEADELGEVAGGIFMPPVTDWNNGCPGNSQGRHLWVKTGLEEEPHSFLWWDYTEGYDHEECTLCGQTRRVRV